MIGEVWQLLVAGSIGVTVVVLWLLIIYLPRRSWDGDKESKPRKDDD